MLPSEEAFISKGRKGARVWVLVAQLKQWPHLKKWPVNPWAEEASMDKVFRALEANWRTSGDEVSSTSSLLASKKSIFHLGWKFLIILRTLLQPSYISFLNKLGPAGTPFSMVWLCESKLCLATSQFIMKYNYFIPCTLKIFGPKKNLLKLRQMKLLLEFSTLMTNSLNIARWFNLPCSKTLESLLTLSNRITSLLAQVLALLHIYLYSAFSFSTSCSFL